MANEVPLKRAFKLYIARYPYRFVRQSLYM